MVVFLTCVRRKIGLGALALNTNIFSFSFYIFNFLATVPTPFVASARARGDADLASRCDPGNAHLERLFLGGGGFGSVVSFFRRV